MAGWHITAQLDRDSVERAKINSTFRIVNLQDDDGNDLTELVDQNIDFHSIVELKQAIAKGFAQRLEVRTKFRPT
jgi:hypothetical protein